MKAVIVDNGSLRVEERPLPIPGENEIRIKVKAAGVNRPDIFQRKGNYPAPPGVDPDIPGLEVSGVVDAVGTGQIDIAAGADVCALLAGGGYAEYVVVDQRQVLPVPDGFSFIESAGLCETYFTVWSNIMDRGRFRKGEKVLVHGGSSGIGVSAIQLITALGGEVYVTAGSKEKCDFCESLGAKNAINYKHQDFENEIKQGPGSVDIILDMIGGEYAAKNIRILNEEGRLIMINAMQGRMADVDLLRIMVKRIWLTGSTLRTRDAAFKGKIRDALYTHVWPHMESKRILPVVYQSLPLEDASTAHAIMEEGRHIGKIILRIE